MLKSIKGKYCSVEGAKIYFSRNLMHKSFNSLILLQIDNLNFLN